MKINASNYQLLVQLIFGFLLVFGFSLNSSAEVKQGKILHDKNCMKCHSTEVYTRKNRQISSLPELNARVMRCYKVAGANWTDKEIKSVVDYLNQAYYKFKK